MSRWSDRASQRLRDGEEITADIPFGGNGVVVTTQRLLAFTPDSNGANYRALELPNVEAASFESNGNTDWLAHVAKTGLAAVVGGVVGYTQDFSGLFSLEKINTEAAGQTGVGSLLGMLSSISQLLRVLDDAFLIGGLLAFGLCLGAFGLYLESRTHGLWITVAGEDDLYVPAPKSATHELSRLQRHIRSDPDPEFGPHPEPDPEPDSEPDSEPEPTTRDDPLEPRPE